MAGGCNLIVDFCTDGFQGLMAVLGIGGDAVLLGADTIQFLIIFFRALSVATGRLLSLGWGGRGQWDHDPEEFLAVVPLKGIHKRHGNNRVELNKKTGRLGKSHGQHKSQWATESETGIEAGAVGVCIFGIGTPGSIRYFRDRLLEAQ